MKSDCAEWFRAAQCGKEVLLSAMDDKRLKLMRRSITCGVGSDAGEQGIITAVQKS
jgi:hypothetical protein